MVPTRGHLAASTWGMVDSRGAQSEHGEVEADRCSRGVLAQDILFSSLTMDL